MVNATPTYAQLLDWWYQGQMKQYQQPQQIQDGGFMVMPTEDAALKYPVAPGNSITFKIENQPLLIEKTMGFSKMDSPQIKYFDVVERKARLTEDKPIDPEYVLKTDFDTVMSNISEVKEEIAEIKNRLEDGV